MNKKVYSLEEIKNKIKENEKFLKEKYHVRGFLLFGSYAKGEQTQDSDIDLLVDFQKVIDMFEMIDLQEYLQNLFGKKIDLGTKNGLKSFIKKTILKEAINL
ncbi:MAG TPA: nucleotidyltransferase family protein [Candidatus Gastranaerophilaceae bacterium]|nr:nucleotidyltransferase family protein [Candidatus Gastranaerophilaceae bacterium]HPT41569.1 nucleotidyltransferase family protein [Candidatus Gastranaerophilaceae bacterium]